MGVKSMRAFLSHFVKITLVAQVCIPVGGSFAMQKPEMNQVSNPQSKQELVYDQFSNPEEKRGKRVKQPAEFAIKSHPLMDPGNCEILYRLAQEISRRIDKQFKGKKQLLVGLGQSPAYLLKMIQLIDAKKNRTDRSYKHTAFSGYFDSYYLQSLDNEDFFYGNEKHYSVYLAKNGLSSQDIAQLQRDDIVPIVVDVCWTGSSLRAFLEIFFEPSNRPVALCIQNESMAAAMPPTFLHADDLHVVVCEQSADLLQRISATDDFNDRLVVHFSPEEWATVNPFDFTLHENAKILLANLEQFVNKQFQ